ncbi:MAG: hypothetical protein GY696_10470 [Gammaproteobacteria bacterium]|nr:hypothetical protein [Gammaproteobacteria bacterium]
MTEIEERAAQLRKEEEGQKVVASKIRAMESKLLSGGENILDHTNEQQRSLELKRQELAEQRVSGVHFVCDPITEI